MRLCSISAHSPRDARVIYKVCLADPGWTLPGAGLDRLARNAGLCRDRFTALDSTGEPELDFTGLPTPATA